MATTPVPDDTALGARSMGHIALHYKTAEEGPLAARLMAMLGFVQTQDLVLPNGSHFYAFVVDPKHAARADGIVFLSLVPDAQRDLLEAMRGDPDIDARLDRPPIYAGVTRYAYSRTGVQAFVETDILSSGILGESMFLEFDYVFPGTGARNETVLERG